MRGLVVISTIAVLTLVGLGSGLLYFSSRQDGSLPEPSSDSKPAPSLIDRVTLDSLSPVTGEQLDYSHLAANLTPPTNKWFSGFALQATPRPGFSYPNSFKPTNNGFEMSLPQIKANSDLIIGSHRADIPVHIVGASSYKITRYDELTVDLTYYKGKTALATVTVARGSPYVFMTAKQRVVIRAAGFSKQKSAIKRGHFWYGLQATGSWQADGLRLSPKQTMALYSASQSGDLSLLKRYAPNVVTSAKVSYALTSRQVSTSFTFTTRNHRPTVFAYLPHQQHGKKLGSVSYHSILGTLRTAVGTTFTYDIEPIPVASSLTIHSLSAIDQAVLREQLHRDAAASQLDKQDSYFAGKQLYRAAQLLDLAYQLGDSDTAKQLQAQLKTRLTGWLTKGKSTPQSFGYNRKAHGIVGRAASFGSSTEFNDHHFHYGYFIYAASVLARYDEDFLLAYKPMVNLLVADIANYKNNEPLPLRRVFDPYVGHSWAGGTAPYSDGNDQESVSEAMNAWTAVVLWGHATKNTALENEGRWLLANEAAAAQWYWYKSNASKEEYLKQYTAPLVSLVWGGKREYRTFFSEAPNAKLAIQLLPMNPTMQFLQADSKNLIFKTTDIRRPYGDFILMAQRGATIEQARSLPDAAIDDGNSRTYLYAWVLTH